MCLKEEIHSVNHKGKKEGMISGRVSWKIDDAYNRTFMVLMIPLGCFFSIAMHNSIRAI